MAFGPGNDSTTYPPQTPPRRPTSSAGSAVSLADRVAAVGEAASTSSATDSLMAAAFDTFGPGAPATPGVRLNGSQYLGEDDGNPLQLGSAPGTPFSSTGGSYPPFGAWAPQQTQQQQTSGSALPVSPLNPSHSDAAVQTTDDATPIQIIIPQPTRRTRTDRSSSGSGNSSDSDNSSGSAGSRSSAQRQLFPATAGSSSPPALGSSPPPSEYPPLVPVEMTNTVTGHQPFAFASDGGDGTGSGGFGLQSQQPPVMSWGSMLAGNMQDHQPDTASRLASLPDSSPATPQSLDLSAAPPPPSLGMAGTAVASRPVGSSVLTSPSAAPFASDSQSLLAAPLSGSTPTSSGSSLLRSPLPPHSQHAPATTASFPHFSTDPASHQQQLHSQPQVSSSLPSGFSFALDDSDASLSALPVLERTSQHRSTRKRTARGAQTGKPNRWATGATWLVFGLAIVAFAAFAVLAVGASHGIAAPALIPAAATLIKTSAVLGGISSGTYIGLTSTFSLLGLVSGVVGLFVGGYAVSRTVRHFRTPSSDAADGPAAGGGEYDTHALEMAALLLSEPTQATDPANSTDPHAATAVVDPAAAQPQQKSGGRFGLLRGLLTGGKGATSSTSAPLPEVVVTSPPTSTDPMAYNP